MGAEGNKEERTFNLRNAKVDYKSINNMKSLNVIPYWGAEYGGPFVNVSNICANLILKGHESSIITTSKATEQYISAFPWQIAGQNINLPIYVCKRLEDSFCFSGEFIKKFIEVVYNSDCVLIHGLWRFPTTFAATFCRTHRIPYCIFTHAMMTPWSLSQRKLYKEIYFRLFEKNNLNKANCIFAYRDDERIALERKKVRAKVFYFTSALNREEVLASHKKRQEAKNLTLSNFTTILYLSRIHPKKGLLLLVKAIKDIIKIRSDIRLIVAGPVEDALYFKKIKDFIKNNKLENQINFKGTVIGEEKIKIFSESDIFVLPSVDEGSPLVILEAMSFGLPVIVTSGFKMPEIDNKMGYIVEQNPEAIAKAILKLIEYKDLARNMGTAGYEYVLNNFTWDRKIDELVKVIKDCDDFHGKIKSCTYLA